MLGSTHPSRCAPAAACAVEHATNTPERVELQLLEKAKKKDKKIKLTVLTSTRPVAPHIDGCISTVSVCTSLALVQAVLISTFPASDTSSFS